MLGRLLLQLLPTVKRKWVGKGLVLTVTYLAYAAATAARLPYSIAKTSLRPEQPSPSSPGWEPFTGGNGQVLLGTMDTIFMAAYASCMPIMGSIADRTNQVAFLALGLLLVGINLAFLGQSHDWNVHVYSYFAAFTFLGGAAQSICYPCVIAVISKWCGQSNMGLILGVWSSCTPLGTIVGKLLTTAALGIGWWATFTWMGIATGVFSVVVLLFLVGDPHDVQLLRPGEARRLAAAQAAANGADRADAPLNRPVGFLLPPAEDAGRAPPESHEEPVPVKAILAVPGMIAYCFACFFSKLAYYAFVFWLPFYLDQVFHYSNSKAGTMSTFFDWGGFLGGILGGLMIDRLKLRAPVLISFQLASVPMLGSYNYLSKTMTLSDGVNGALLFFLGFTVTTPYSLITSVMATYLGRHPCLQGNQKAIATVTAILDGVGSFGAVVQGLVIGTVSSHFGWTVTFGMLMVFSSFSALCLIRPALQECRERRTRLAAACVPGLSTDGAAGANGTSLQGRQEEGRLEKGALIGAAG